MSIPPSTLPLWALGMILLTVVVQGYLLFLDARRHTRFAWLWGIWGLLQFPLPTITYLLFVKKIWRKRR